ncbi:CRISPR-associated helicase Cas3' [Candidatus Methylospira mobilis]|uniref:CRISPR-associated helicase Cas3 n=1 Tax=Candidatus Methylospira mobilis TaxID=1808979 RepID=A0A5Q0BGI5_9GAMM|nr:CRISPR-associated helicase Cas3' [Candidatus Methylospira mobilis]QFY41331.1 CRISPR-associated helicase Cas3' [Candidatus Methylospira mobilis]WNV05441.1 CRISPR-associated helicase Cas3' [Candidatus Methylospira mobilis]
MTYQDRAYFYYWGKADPVCRLEQKWHPLAYHCLDVAAVGVAYLEKSSLLKSCCELLNCSEPAFWSWSAFFLSLHDLGKFSEAFQAQRPDLILELQKREPHPSKIYSERHDSLGFWLWDEYLVDEVLLKIGIDDTRSTQRGLKCWLLAVTGHHGMPPKPSGNADSFFRREDKQAAADFVQAMAELLLTKEARCIPSSQNFKTAGEMLSWWFAGVTVLADWLGSNIRFFPYRNQPTDLEQYWKYAQGQATEALAHAGVSPSAIEKGRSLNDLFRKIQDASPLQQWAVSVEIPQAPQIYLLEDVTGAGKTEAAMMLAYRLMEQGFAEGFFIGLPTMATANAMYKRVAEVYQKLFADKTHLVLAHGHKKLVEDFAASILPPDTPEQDRAQLDETASARCSAWLADHSKRALLASAGIGTIDQALLAVLHSKHQSLRLLGLFNKVLIVDEVHACDAYMQGVLEVLLEFHARTNGPVILLSATLPSRMKQALLNAYAKGRNQVSAPALQSAAYPLATCWHEGQTLLREDALASRSCVSRTVQVHYEADDKKVFAHIITALQQGLCVGWIRNTVADAMTAYQRLSQTISPEKITLFHARFALADRLGKEEQVLSFFGENSQQQDRQGRLMIATQVAEQSLDVDFDVLITDLAPIDRILQRAGRLQRHVRDVQGNRLIAADARDERSAPCLWVYAPVWTEQPKSDWYSAVFEKAQYVYGHHGQLWLTAKALQKGSFTMPVDARNLIEAVFSETEILPVSLTKSALKAEGQERSEASLAQLNTLKIVGGYQRGEINDWWSEAKTPSRLGEETMEVMLAKWADGVLQPWAEGVWTYSMVKVAARWLAKVDPPADEKQKAAYLHLQQTLPSQGKWCVLLPLTQRADGVWEGQAWTAGKEKSEKKPELLSWLYDTDFGLRLAEAQNGEAEE